MSQITNDDVMGCVISFLDINTMENLAESTEENKKIVEKYQHVYYKNYLAELWGNELFVILEKSHDLRKEIKNIYNEYKNQNITSIKKVLNKFYQCVCEGTLKFNHDIFMFIYDICYTTISSQSYANELRMELFSERELFFLESEMIEESKSYKYIKNATTYMDRWDGA